MSKALYIKGTSTLVAHISDAQLKRLVDLLEEEHPDDRDYYIDETVLAYLTERGLDKGLIASLTQALGAVGSRDETFTSGSSRAREGIEIVWREE